MATSEPVEPTGIEQGEEMVITPPVDFSTEVTEGENKYGQMLDDALAESGAPVEVNAPIVNPPEQSELADVNPAASFAPPVPTAPEVNGVPDMNYMPMPGDTSIPEPPTPPVDFSTPAPAPEAAAPEVPSPVEMGGQPAMQDQVYNEQAANPGAFKIPGMQPLIYI